MSLEFHRVGERKYAVTSTAVGDHTKEDIDYVARHQSGSIDAFYPSDADFHVESLRQEVEDADGTSLTKEELKENDEMLAPGEFNPEALLESDLEELDESISGPGTPKNLGPGNTGEDTLK